MTPAEMVRRALAEVGLGDIALADLPRPDAPMNVRFWHRGHELECRKAGALMLLRMQGADTRVLCARHPHHHDACGRVTVAEILLDPTATCGAA